MERAVGEPDQGQPKIKDQNTENENQQEIEIPKANPSTGI